MIRYSLATLLLLAFTHQTFSQEFVERWTTLRSLGSSARYDDIYFINANTGWAAGGGNGNIYKTVNGGTSWTLQAHYNHYLRSIEFLDHTVGFCGGLDGTFFKTTDGGTTWTDIAPTISPQPPGVCGLAKADFNTIYGVGAWFEPAYVVKSVDRGETWTHIDMSGHAISLIDAYFFDADHGFVTGTVTEQDGGVVLYTADGGVTWEEKFRTQHVGDRIWKIQSPDGQHFFGSIETWTGDTRMIKSKDKGQTWEMIQVHPDYYYIQAVGFLDSLHGWTGGREHLFQTKDGGSTWSEATVGSTYNRFQKVNDSVAYLTGELIYKYTKKKKLPPPAPVITGTEGPAPYDPIHYVTVSPNPTTRKADVHVNFGTATMAHIYVCSITGQDLTRIFQGHVDKGKRTFSVDVSGLPPQTYVVVVKTHEGMESAKFVKIADSNGR